MKKIGFSLIELLIALAGIGILTSVFYFYVNPVEIFRCSRDVQRINDLNTLSSAINNYISKSSNLDLDGPYYNYSSNTIFISISKDKQSTSSSFIDNNIIYNIVQPSSTALYRLIDGRGWLPIDFYNLYQRGPRPIEILPVDPLNRFNGNFFYSYSFNKFNNNFELNANIECEKAIERAKNDGGDSDHIYEVGNNLNLIPPIIYGYQRKTLNLPNFNQISNNLITLAAPINNITSTEYKFSNTGNAYLKTNFKFLNTNPYIKIDKKEINLAPYNTSSLKIICDGRGLKNATTVSNTLLIFHNSINIVNPISVSINCTFLSSFIIKIFPETINLESSTNKPTIIKKISFKNEGNKIVNIDEKYFTYKETDFSCPNYVGFSLTSNQILPGKTTLGTFSLNPIAAGGKKLFYCYKFFDIGSEKYKIRVNIKISSTPTPPINVRAENDQSINGFKISWLPSLDDGYSNISNYQIFYTTSSETNVYLPLATLSSNYLYYKHSNLTPGVNYCYKIRSLNKVGYSDFSKIFCLKYLTKPSSPTNFQTLSENERIILVWRSPTNTGGTLIDKYNIYYSENGTNYHYLTEVPHFYNLSTQTYTHLDLKNGKTYYYKITAVNEIGESNFSIISSNSPKNYPLPPSKLIISSSKDGLSLFWDPPQFNQGANIQHYRIYRASNTPSNFVLINTTTATSFLDSPNENILYFYYVTAVNSVGESKRSNINSGCYGEFCNEIFKCLPPPNLSATSTSSGKITLSWDNGSESIFGVYKSTKDEYALIATTTNNSFTISGLKNGKTYYFYVTKIYEESKDLLVCDTESDPSNYVSSTPVSSPLFPIDLRSEREGGEIKLKWKTPFSNEGATITGYFIYRATSSPTSSYYYIGSVDSNSVSNNGYYIFTDSNINPGNFYSYYVRATNSKGLGFRSNTYSSFVSICWANLYKTDSNLGFNKIIFDSNNYIASGWFYNTNTRKYNNFFTFLDDLGNIKKAKYLDWNKENAFNFVIASSSYFLGGYTSDNNYDGLLVKIASTGEAIEWAKLLGGRKEDRFINGYLLGREIALVGYTSSWGEGQRDVWFTVIDVNGNLKFNKILGTRKDDIGQKVVILQDGSYILAGNTNISGNYDFFVIKLDNKGNILWQKLYGGDSDDFVSDLELEGNNLVLVGYTNSFSTNKDYDVFITKLYSDGSVLKQMLYKSEREDLANDLEIDRNSNYILAGRTDSYYSKNNDIFILNINSTTLEIIKQSIFNTLGQDNTNSIILGKNNNYLVAGRTNIDGYKGLIFSFNDQSDFVRGISYFGLGFYPVNIFNTSTFNIYSKHINISIINENLILNNINLTLRDLSLNKDSLGYQICNVGELLSLSNLNYDQFYLKTFFGENNIYLYLNEYFQSDPLKILSKINHEKYIYYNTSSDRYIYIASTSNNYFYHNTNYQNNCYIVNNLYIFFIPIGLNNFSNEYCSQLDNNIKPPLPPQNASSSLGSFNISITWQPPDYNGGSNIKFYKIYQATTTNNFILLATTTATSYNTTIDENNYYCYYITAVNSIGESDKSNYTCSIVNNLEKPSNISFSFDNSSNKINIRWNNINNVDYYLIKLNNYNLATTIANSYSFYIDFFENNEVYIYPSKNGIINNFEFKIIGKYITLPIRYLRSDQINQNSIRLDWAASTYLEDIIGFNIYRKNYGGSYKFIASTSSKSYIDTNLISGEEYCYQVTIQYKFGESLPSNDSCLVFKSLPAKPEVIIKQRKLSAADEGVVWLQFRNIKEYSKEAGFDKIKYFEIKREPDNKIATITPDNINYLDYNNLGYATITYHINSVNNLGRSATLTIGVGYNEYLARFNLYKITLDNQMYFLGSVKSGENMDFNNLILGQKDLNHKSFNRSIYISINDPPKYIGRVTIDIDLAYSNNTTNIREFNLMCDNYKINLSYSADNQQYPLYRFCSNISINLIWDKNLKDQDIPKIKIEGIEIN